MNRLLITTAALALTLSAGSAFAQMTPAAPDAAAPTADTVTITPHGDIVQTLKAAGEFSILIKALDATGLTPVLEGAGPLTLFAPTDAAFQALPPDELASLMKPENAARLQGILTYHVINAAVPPAKITGSKGPIRTVAGAEVQVDGAGSPLKINTASVLGEAAVSNGTIYAVNQVLMPPSAAAPASGGR